jgi:hypothetical protein
MIRRRIALVTVETVYREATMPTPHQPVTTDFCEYGRRTNGSNGLIASDYRFNRKFTGEGVKQWYVVTVHLDVTRHDRQAQHSALHSQQRCLQNIDVVYLFRSCKPQRKRVGTLADFTRELMALLRSQALGIPETDYRIFRIEYDRGRYDRPRQRPAPCLINASHWGSINRKS